MKLCSWRYEAMRPVGIIHVWYDLTVEKVTDKKIFIAPIDPVRTTRRVVVDRVALEKTGSAPARGLGHDGRWPYVFTDVGRKVEEERLRDQLRRTEEFRREFHEWRYGTPAVDGYTWPSTAAEIRRRFRELAAKAHPDAGGSHDEFVKLNASYRRALSMAVSG